MITASLIGGQSPQLVQIVVDTTPPGEAWTVTGATDDTSWPVPGGAGVGDGQQLTLVDNRSPLNVPVLYTFTAESITETAAPVTVTTSYDLVLQSLDGQAAVGVDWLAGSSDIEWGLQQEVFTVPGRDVPVVRYSTTTRGGGSWQVGLESSRTQEMRALVSSGAPIVFRCGVMVLDFPQSGVVLPRGLSAVGYPTIDYREWAIPFLYVDDPFMDQRLGAFSWDTFDDAMAGRSWDEFDTVMSGLAWDSFDTVDWSTL